MDGLFGAGQVLIHDGPQGRVGGVELVVGVVVAPVHARQPDPRPQG